MRSCTGTRSVTVTRVGSESRFQPKPEFAFRVSITVQSRYTGLDERDYRGYASPAALSSKRTAYYVRVRGVVCAEFGGYRGDVGGGGFAYYSLRRLVSVVSPSRGSRPHTPSAVRVRY